MLPAKPLNIWDLLPSVLGSLWLLLADPPLAVQAEDFPAWEHGRGHRACSAPHLPPSQGGHHPVGEAVIQVPTVGIGYSVPVTLLRGTGGVSAATKVATLIPEGAPACFQEVSETLSKCPRRSKTPC